MFNIHYYNMNGGYAAVDLSNKDKQTGLYAYGRGPRIAGDVTTIEDTVFEIGRLPQPIISSETVPEEWQLALNMLPVVLPLPVVIPPIYGPSGSPAQSEEEKLREEYLQLRQTIPAVKEPLLPYICLGLLAIIILCIFYLTI